jgi:hypothetical protein
MTTAASAYPVTLEIDYPERQSRWKTLLRLFLAIPVFLFWLILAGSALPLPLRGGRGAIYAVGVAGGVTLAIWITIVLRARIPRWLFDFQVALMRWEVRALSYFALLTDTYPPFEGDYPIRLEVRYPERPARWKVLIWKAITSIPHMVVLIFLSIGAFFAVIIAWFAILVTGRFPQGLHGYVAGVIRWSMRVQGYFLSLTDDYPPFSLSADAGAASRETYMLSSIGGWLLGAGLVAVAVTAIVLSRETVTVHVPYDQLVAGRVAGSQATADVWNLKITLTRAVDPANEDFPLLVPDQDRRLVAFRLEFRNDSGGGRKVTQLNFRLTDSDGDWHDPLLVFVGGRAAPVTIGKHASAEAIVLFELEKTTRPDKLLYVPGTVALKDLTYQFK